MKRNYPDFIQAYLEYTSNHESTERVRKWTIISCMAAAMERKLWLDRGYYTLYPNLYVFIIGKSGLIKKSTSTAIGVNLLKDTNQISFMSEKLTSSSLISQMKNSGTTFSHNGTTVNQSAVFAYASELAVFMGDVHGSISELLTTFYDCQPNDPSKAWVYKTKFSGDDEIFGPCLNILGASTPAWLERCLPKNSHEGGFSSRIVFVVEPNGPKHFVAWPEVSESSQNMRSKLVHDLATIAGLCGEINVTDGAKKLFEDWYVNHMKTVVPNNTDNRFAGYLGRKGDLILKIAMIKCVNREGDLTINKSDMNWAGKEIEDLERDMMISFENEQACLLEGHEAGIVADVIRKHEGPIEGTELQAALDMDTKTLKRSLDNLEKMKVIKVFWMDEKIYCKMVDPLK